MTQKENTSHLPIRTLIKKHFLEYRVPNNLNVWYVLGVVMLMLLINQLISGIWLVMHYVPTAEGAFDSIQTFIRIVPYGFLLHDLHAVGASLLFVALYLHMFRSIYYGSYLPPREYVWCFGMLLFWLMLVEGFCGYVLPYGQMSYWGAEVLSALPNSLPFGDVFVRWLRGGAHVSDITLRRFFALHIIAVPALIYMVIRFHLTTLRHVGSNNPTGRPQPSIPFHPQYTAKDGFAIACALAVLLSIVFFAPTFFGYIQDPLNFVPADPLHTPQHIVPMWYIAPFYAMLRAVPSAIGGVILVACALLLPVTLPWLDRSTIRIFRERNWMAQVLLLICVTSFLSLIYLGLHPEINHYSHYALTATLGYFAFFIGVFLF